MPGIELVHVSKRDPTGRIPVVARIACFGWVRVKSDTIWMFSSDNAPRRSYELAKSWHDVLYEQDIFFSTSVWGPEQSGWHFPDVTFKCIQFCILTQISLLELCSVMRCWPRSPIDAQSRKCHRHFDDICVVSSTQSCQFDNIRCSQWRKFRQNGDVSVSVLIRYQVTWLSRSNVSWDVDIFEG